MRTRGLLVMRMPSPPRVPCTQLCWISDPPDLIRTDLRWFIDGYVIVARWPEITTVAAALVGVSLGGDLVAYGISSRLYMPENC